MKIYPMRKGIVSKSISIVEKIRIDFKKVAQERMTAVYRVILKYLSSFYSFNRYLEVGFLESKLKISSSIGKTE